MKVVCRQMFHQYCFNCLPAAAAASLSVKEFAELTRSKLLLGGLFHDTIFQSWPLVDWTLSYIPAAEGQKYDNQGLVVKHKDNLAAADLPDQST